MVLCHLSIGILTSNLLPTSIYQKKTKKKKKRQRKSKDTQVRNVIDKSTCPVGQHTGSWMPNADIKILPEIKTGQLITGRWTLVTGHWTMDTGQRIPSPISQSINQSNQIKWSIGVWWEEVGLGGGGVLTSYPSPFIHKPIIQLLPIKKESRIPRVGVWFDFYRSKGK